MFTAVIGVISLGATAGLLKLKHTTAGGQGPADGPAQRRRALG